MNFLVTIWIGLSLIEFCSADPLSKVSSLPSFSPSPSPQVEQVPLNKKALLKEYEYAQSLEVKALEHRNKMELKELKAAQGTRLKEWESKEKQARHEFFQSHMKGPERRTYIQDYIKRREALREQLSQERTQRSHELTQSVSRLRQNQSEKLVLFKNSLDENKRPASDLWPQPGH